MQLMWQFRQSFTVSLASNLVTMKAFQLGLVLVLVGAVLASARQTNTDMATTASNSDAAKAADYYAHKNVRNLCLRELKQYNCRYVGCPNILNCDDEGNPECSDCQQHAVGQSDVGCCPHERSAYDQKDLADNLMTSARVGACDWDMDIFVCTETHLKRRKATPGERAGPRSTSLDVVCADPIPMGNGAYQIGTAWGTCTFNAASESCGHPFCDKMILSFQGGVYATTAYAKADYLTPQFDVEDPVWQGCFPTGSIVPGLIRTAAFQKAVESTGLLKKLQANVTAKHANHNKSAKKTSDDWEEGLAVVVSGPVTVTSLKHRVEYDSGMLQYVPSWIGSPLTEGSPGPTAMVVTPYTYDISLSKDKGYEGGHEGAYEEHYKSHATNTPTYKYFLMQM